MVGRNGRAFGHEFFQGDDQFVYDEKVFEQRVRKPAQAKALLQKFRQRLAETPAFDAVGTIKKVDTEKGVLYIHANGQDRTVKFDKDVKVLGTDGKPRWQKSLPVSVPRAR